MDTLAHFENYISPFANHSSVLAVFFNLEKAYDTTWRYHILQQLQSHGIRGNMSVFIKSFLTYCTFRVIFFSSTSSFTHYEGVLQGSVLSTTLFLIAVNSLLSVLPSGIRSSLFVDDFIMYTLGPSIPTLRQQIQSAISLTFSWATNHGFRFSASNPSPSFFPDHA